MTITIAEAMEGADFEGGEVFGDCHYNNLKNHWRANYGGEPCGSAGLGQPQPGMILSDSYDDRLYHVTLASGCPCSEIVQACVPLSDDREIGFGHDWDAQLGYDELVNDALVLGIPVAGKRGLIICDQADIMPDITAAPYSLGTTTQPTIYMLDADEDSYLGIGHQADDKPGIWSGPTDATPLAMQYEANADVIFFENSGAGENRNIYIYGYVAAGAAVRHGMIRVDETWDEFVLEAENNANLEGVSVSLLETNQRFRVRQNSDIMSMYLTTDDAYLTWSDGALNLQNTEADTNAEVHIHGNGTGYGLLIIYDEDDAEWLVLFAQGGSGRIQTGGVTPGPLYIQQTISQSIYIWSGITAGNPDFYIYGWNTASATRRYGRFRMDDTWDEFLIEAENHADHEGITVNLLETNQRFRVRQNADILSMYLTTDDAYLEWSDGALNLQTVEADTNSEVHIHGAGTGRGELRIYDEDDAEYLRIEAMTGAGIIRTAGATPIDLHLQYITNQSITCFLGILSGNPNLSIYGWNTASTSTRWTRLRMDDVNDEFLIEAESHIDHEGITVSLTETNQRFRVRQNADYMAMYCTATDAYLTWSDGALNLQTEAMDTNSEVHIHGAGTGEGRLNIFDEDDNEQLYLASNSGYGFISVLGVTPLSLRLQFASPQDITYWAGITAGNPDFQIYGWITEGAARRYSQFRMDDTFNEFYIEAEADANHEGITISLLEAAQEFRLRGVGGIERFHIDQTGILGYMRQGELFQWTYQGDLADEADFTLPAFTDSCWGFIQAGDNEEYALFSVDNVGNVTLISNSANVVANANTDGKICLGIVSPEEPLTVRNRLGATENINLIIWYS